MVQAADVDARIASYAAFVQALYHEQERQVTFSDNVPASIDAAIVITSGPPPVQDKETQRHACRRIQRWWRGQRQRRHYRRLVQRMRHAVYLLFPFHLFTIICQRGGDGVS